MSLWVDKYRPTKLEHLHYHDDLSANLQQLVSRPSVVADVSAACMRAFSALMFRYQVHNPDTLLASPGRAFQYIVADLFLPAPCLLSRLLMALSPPQRLAVRRFPPQCLAAPPLPSPNTLIHFTTHQTPCHIHHNDNGAHIHAYGGGVLAHRRRVAISHTCCCLDHPAPARRRGSCASCVPSTAQPSRRWVWMRHHPCSSTCPSALPSFCPSALPLASALPSACSAALPVALPPPHSLTCVFATNPTPSCCCGFCLPPNYSHSSPSLHPLSRLPPHPRLLRRARVVAWMPAPPAGGNGGVAPTTYYRTRLCSRR